MCHSLFWWKATRFVIRFDSLLIYQHGFPLEFRTKLIIFSKFFCNASSKKMLIPVWMLNNVWTCHSSQNTTFRIVCQLKRFQKHKPSNKRSYRVWSNVYCSHEKKNINRDAYVISLGFLFYQCPIQLSFRWITSNKWYNIQILKSKSSLHTTIRRKTLKRLKYCKTFSNILNRFVDSTRWVVLLPWIQIWITRNSTRYSSDIHVKNRWMIAIANFTQDFIRNSTQFTSTFHPNRPKVKQRFQIGSIKVVYSQIIGLLNGLSIRTTDFHINFVMLQLVWCFMVVHILSIHPTICKRVHFVIIWLIEITK